MADRYDAWYDSPKGARLYAVELACIRLALGQPPPHPWLEVGVGTGRFASALAIDEGADAAAAPLALAAQRGVRVAQAPAERLPYPEARFGAAFMIMTLCFVDDPLQALRECARVLRPDGVAVLTFVPRDSAWGEAYERKARAGHPFYAASLFYPVAEVERLAGLAGFCVSGGACCLLEGPDAEVNDYAAPREGRVPGAGFVALRLTRAGQEAGGGT
jgi:SAM-dependent methyltransferase